jgi:hypothetical protein
MAPRYTNHRERNRQPAMTATPTRPPSTSMTVPWTNAASSLARYTRWRDAVVAHYGSQTHWGCPIGALTAELAGREPTLAADLVAHMDRWRGYLEAGRGRMVADGSLAPDADPRTLALATFAALHGGLQLMAITRSLEPLEAALDGALVNLRAHAA